MHTNEKILFQSEVIKPWTESYARKNCDDRQRGTFATRSKM